MSNEIKTAIAQYTDLDTLLWYHEELDCPTVTEIIREKIAKGEEPRFGYGKLMERLMYLEKNEIPIYDQLVAIADRRLKSYDLPLEPPITVAGDASGSMQVAIETATIMSSLLTAISDAELKFWNNRLIYCPMIPETAEDVIRIAKHIGADGSTAPAAALYPLYHDKRKVNFLIYVTDEEENEPFREFNFTELFDKYLKEVNPDTKLVFISFVEGKDPGKMFSNIKSSLGFEPLQFRFSKNRPDLTKLDSLLGFLSSESAFFQSECTAMATLSKYLNWRECIQFYKHKSISKNFFTFYLWTQVIHTLISCTHLSEIQRIEQIHKVLTELATLLENVNDKLFLNEILGLKTRTEQQVNFKILFRQLNTGSNSWQEKYMQSINHNFKRQIEKPYELLQIDCPFYSISKQMILKVFSYLTAKELRVLSEVSKYFKFCTIDRQLWEKYAIGEAEHFNWAAWTSPPQSSASVSPRLSPQASPRELEDTIEWDILFK